jgi:glycosyltransferase involved in cell wall biosynthesis
LALDVADFEVIIIDDCSKDNTIAVVEKYAKQHTNITLLRQAENHRQGAARNRGVAIAKGKYIVYVDSDDESAKGVVDALQLAEKNDLDMVAMHYLNVDQHGNITEKEPITLEGVFTGVELQTKHPYWGTAPWPYIYKTSFLQQVNYPFVEDVLFEDSDYVNVHLYHANRMMYNPSLAYHMYYNATSTTHTTTYKQVADYVLLGTRMLKFYHSLEDKTSTYALGIREGGSYNIWMSCKRLIKLSSIADVRAFYERIDTYINRADYLHYTEPAYCWTWWTKLCLKHKKIAIMLVAIGQWGYKVMGRRMN